MAHSSVAEFQARILLAEDEVMHIDVHVHEFLPTAFGEQAHDGWVHEHLAGLSRTDFEQLFKLKPGASVQVLCAGCLSGRSGGYYSDDWDEELEIQSFSTREIPPEYWVRYSAWQDERNLLARWCAAGYSSNQPLSE